MNWKIPAASGRIMLRRIFAGLLLGSLFCGAWAQTPPFPNKSVKIIVPSTPGGLLDVSARLIGLKLSGYWNVPVVVENKPGAAMTIGTQLAAKSPADGYTLLLSHEGAIVVSPVIIGTQYSRKDLAPVAQVWDTPLVLLVNKDVPATNFAELNDYVKKNPGKLNYAFSDVLGELYSDMFKEATGWDYTNIGYKGNADRMRSVMAGETQLALISAIDGVAAAKSGRARVIGITSQARSRKLPELATLDESGLKGFTIMSWGGLFAPAGTPREILATISADARRALSTPEAVQTLEAAGAESGGAILREQFAKRIEADVVRWRALAERRGLKTYDQ